MLKLSNSATLRDAKTEALWEQLIEFLKCGHKDMKGQRLLIIGQPLVHLWVRGCWRQVEQSAGLLMALCRGVLCGTAAVVVAALCVGETREGAEVVLQLAAWILSSPHNSHRGQRKWTQPGGREGEREGEQKNRETHGSGGQRKRGRKLEEREADRNRKKHTISATLWSFYESLLVTCHGFPGKKFWKVFGERRPLLKQYRVTDLIQILDGVQDHHQYLINCSLAENFIQIRAILFKLFCSQTNRQTDIHRRKHNLLGRGKNHETQRNRERGTDRQS